MYRTILSNDPEPGNVSRGFDHFPNTNPVVLGFHVVLCSNLGGDLPNRWTSKGPSAQKNGIIWIDSAFDQPPVERMEVHGISVLTQEKVISSAVHFHEMLCFSQKDFQEEKAGGHFRTLQAWKTA